MKKLSSLIPLEYGFSSFILPLDLPIRKNNSFYKITSWTLFIKALMMNGSIRPFTFSIS